MKKKYGVFVWTVSGIYPEKNAVKIFEIKVWAEKMCNDDYNSETPHNYVIREIL